MKITSEGKIDRWYGFFHSFLDLNSSSQLFPTPSLQIKHTLIIYKFILKTTNIHLTKKAIITNSSQELMS
jgi:hypothetical protein